MKKFHGRAARRAFGEKLRRLDRRLAAVAASRPSRTLAALGLHARDLTPGFLLAHLSWRQSSVLQALADVGCLPLLPPECLTERVVLARQHYQYENEFTALHFIIYCAGRGWYRQLPASFQSRDFILRPLPHALNGASTPLQAAASRVKLHTLPLEVLQTGDIDPVTIHHSDMNRQIEVIDHLLLPDDISHINFDHCLARDYLPPWLMRHLTAEYVFGNYGYGGSLVPAMLWQMLHKLPPSLFINHYPDVRQAIGYGLDVLKTAPDFHENRSACYRSAVVWLTELARQIFEERPAPVGSPALAENS